MLVLDDDDDDVDREVALLELPDDELEDVVDELVDDALGLVVGTHCESTRCQISCRHKHERRREDLSYSRDCCTSKSTLTGSRRRRCTHFRRTARMQSVLRCIRKASD